jgi:hypothetical protein
MSEERQNELLKLAQNNEAEVKSLLKTFYQTQAPDCMGELLQFVWSLELARKAMKDMSLDIGKLPVG